MRPGSRFLKAVSQLEVPDHLSIYCFHSNKDGVSTGQDGIFRPENSEGANITAVPMNHISHFEYLYKRDVADRIATILGAPEAKESVPSNEGGSDEKDNVEHPDAS